MPACPEKNNKVRLNNGAASVTQSEKEALASATDVARDVEVGEEEFVPSEGGWGWVVCFASFWTNGTVFGTLNTFGVIYVEMMKEFENSDDANLAFKLSWIGALQICMTFMMSSVASVLVDRVGIRPTAVLGSIIASLGMLLSSFVTSISLLYLTYGLLLGFGSSLVYNPSLVILGHYFRKRLGVVNGIVSFGSAVFTMVLPFGIQYLVAKVGLSNTLRVLAGVFSLLIPLSFTWLPKYSQRHNELDHFLSTESVYKSAQGAAKFLQKFLNVDIWKNKGYVIWAIALPISFLGYFVPFVHLVNHVRIVLPEYNGGILVMCIGVTSGISRLIFGLIADLPSINRIRMQQFALIFLSIITVCIPFIRHFYVLMALTLLMGVFDGCFICLLGPIAFDLLGPSGAAQGLGCLLSLSSIPMTAGPPLAGLVFDLTNSYNIAFWAGGAPPLIGALLLFLIPSERQSPIAMTMTANIAAMSTENLNQLTGSNIWVEDVIVMADKPIYKKTAANPESNSQMEIPHSKRLLPKSPLAC